MEAIKYDAGKAGWHLLPYEAVEEVVKVLDYGSKKYADHNWDQNGGFKWTRLFSAAMRHMTSWIRGESNDPETGFNHLAHAACCLLFLISYSITNNGTDDRRKVKRPEVPVINASLNVIDNSINNLNNLKTDPSLLALLRACTAKNKVNAILEDGFSSSCRADNDEFFGVNHV